MAKITLPEAKEQLLAAHYQLGLPTQEEICAELEREDAESVLKLTVLTYTPRTKR